MRLNEFEDINLAVNFHNELNPRLWDGHRLQPRVRKALLNIANHFKDFLGIDMFDLLDITISGSNAAYTYTPHSDIDLHLVVMIPEEHEEELKELFNAKKYQYNDLHDIRIRGADVELYVQPADQKSVSLGQYSVLNNKWIEVPKRKRARIDQSLVRDKYADLQARIESALKEQDSDRVQQLIDKIKAMRQSGLDQHGEFGPENLAYKALRSKGIIKKLYDRLDMLHSERLSLPESASGYIPSYKERNDPRFKTALTVDIKPDTMQQNASKLGSKISRAGIPPFLRP